MKVRNLFSNGWNKSELTKIGRKTQKQKEKKGKKKDTPVWAELGLHWC